MSTERIPECTGELQHILQAIAKKNTSIQPGSEDSDWPTLFSPTDDQCLLCGTPLGPLEHTPGSNSRAFLLTKVKMLPVKALIKRCPNHRCLARHSYRTWKEGINLYCTHMLCMHGYCTSLSLYIYTANHVCDYVYL